MFKIKDTSFNIEIKHQLEMTTFQCKPSQKLPLKDKMFTYKIIQK